MKKLKDFEKKLKTCSKCGLCQSVCPVYKITGKETIVSRGKFNLLLGLLKGDLNYSKKLDEALSLCLHCKACDDFCPSSIKASEIICAVKNEYSKPCYLFKNNMFFKFKMLFLRCIFNLYRLSHITFFVAKTKNLIKKFGFLGNLFLLFDKLSKINVKRIKIKNANKKIKVIYFEGCFTKYINPSTKNALLNILEKNNVEIIEKNFECCGLSALYEGNYKLYKKLKEKNISLLQEDCDYIICDCATCLSALKEYNCAFSEKIIDIMELLAKINVKNNNKITYHLPCHLREEKEKIEKSLNKIFLNYEKMEEFDSCCGFAGDFCIKFPKISEEISKQKSKNIQNSTADYVLTSCPGCVVGITKGLLSQNIEKNVLNLVEFLEINS